jgi:hypothetical protein
MVSCFLRASRSSRLPFIVPSVAAACFWLVVVCKIFNRRPSTPRAQPISLFFCRSPPFDAPNNGTTTPTRSAPVPVASPLQRPPHRRRQLSVGCCVPPSNGGHLRPRVRPSLYFFGRLIRTPQTTGSCPPNTFRPSLASSETQNRPFVNIGFQQLCLQSVMQRGKQFWLLVTFFDTHLVAYAMFKLRPISIHAVNV